MTNPKPSRIALLLAFLAVTTCSHVTPKPAPAEAEAPATGVMSGLLEAVRVDEEIVVIRRGDALLDFRISLRGDVLDTNRTNVRDPNGHRIPLSEIAIGTHVNVYWNANAEHPDERMAKMIQTAPGPPTAPERD